MYADLPSLRKEDKMVQVALSTLLMRKPKITATIPEDVYQFLSEWADRDQRSLANVVAFVLTTTVRKMRDEQKNGATSPQEQTETPSPSQGKRVKN